MGEEYVQFGTRRHIVNPDPQPRPFRLRAIEEVYCGLQIYPVDRERPVSARFPVCANCERSFRKAAS